MGTSSQLASTTRGRYAVIPRTLIFVTHGSDVLLVRGAAHKGWWAGRLNGVGGHVETGEDILSSARRELVEETGLTEVENLRLAAVVNVALDQQVSGICLFVFTARSLSRTTVASTEGALEWVPVDALAQPAVLDDLRVLVPRVLSLAPTEPPLFAHYRLDERGGLVVHFADEAPIETAFSTAVGSA